MIEGAFLSAGKERGALPIWGSLLSDLGHRNTSIGGQHGPRTSCSATLNSHYRTARYPCSPADKQTDPLRKPTS